MGVRVLFVAHARCEGRGSEDDPQRVDIARLERLKAWLIIGGECRCESSSAELQVYR